MKRITFLALLIVLPILLLSINPHLREVLDKLSFPSFAQDRNLWRLNESVSHYSDGMDWQPGTSIRYFYNVSHPSRPDSIQIWYYDFEVGTWYKSAVAYYSYDVSGYMISSGVIYFYLDEEMPFMRANCFYDEQNRLTNYNIFMPDEETRQWIPVQRLHLFYESNTDYVAYVWSRSYYGNERQDTYNMTNFVWDGQGRIIEEVSHTSLDSLSWSPESRTIRSYHPNDTLTGDQTVHWIAWNVPLGFTWQEQPFPGMVLQEINYWWDWETEAWWPSYRMVFAYDANDLPQRRTSSYWDLEFERWTDDRRTAFTHDANGNRTEELSEYWDQWMEEWYPADYLTHSWEYYSSANDDPGFPANPGIKLHAYPVPFSENLNLRLDSNAKSEVNFR
ncbi:MAG: hypothetical protein Q8M98_11995, partial [Candidatus Cloacimonadaceae bacterium]|nr:hypothetical protein [Candidatus Cloacimonadaceae bacterium]